MCHAEGAAVWRSMRLGEKPHIVIDCQFLGDDPFSTKLVKQLEFIIQVSCFCIPNNLFCELMFLTTYLT